MSDVKLVVASIIKFLKRQLDGDALNVDSRESVEVGVQCLESAFEISSEEYERGLDLLELVRGHGAVTPVTPEDRALAEQYKNRGNECMKNDLHREALDLYSRAIALDAGNAVYFCNRAAAHFKLGDNEAAVADCTAALALQPDYSKAHGRLGLALAALDRPREARAAFARAAQLEPDNQSYRDNMRLADERLAQRGQRPAAALDLAGLLHNPALLNMATEMLADPNMQNLISGLMGGAAAPEARPPTAGGGGSDGGGVDALLEAGQMLAQQMQAANPELVELLRRQVTQRSQPPQDGNPPSQPPSQ